MRTPKFRGLKRRIQEEFLASETRHEFYAFLRGAGFRRAKGCRKKVFVNPTRPFVVKLAAGLAEDFPSKNSRVARFFLWPEFGAECYIDGIHFTLYFQPRASTKAPRSIFARLEEALSRAGACWEGDAHLGNVGLYRGRPVIIDY